MFYDYHMHSYYSADSTTPMNDMVEKSIDLGLKEICFTDHVDYDIIGNPNVMVDYKKYFQEIRNLNSTYNISIKTGIEMGVQKHLIDKCSKDIKSNDFDFVIASVHTIDRNELFTGDFHKGKTQFEAYEGYYKTLYDITKSFNDYSVLGHLDLIKRYGNYNNILEDTLFHDYLEAILKNVIYNGKGIEVNTSSFRYDLPDLTPSSYILKLYKSLGGEVLTLGSDSHNVNQIANDFPFVVGKIKDFGFSHICAFSKMKEEFIKI